DYDAIRRRDAEQRRARSAARNRPRPTAPIVVDPPADPPPAPAAAPATGDQPSLPDGWTFEHDGERARARRHTGRATFWCVGADRETQTAEIAANLEAAIVDGLISAGPGSPPPPDASQVGMLDGINAAQLAEDKHAHCPKHGTFYQPQCWHCKRRRP